MSRADEQSLRPWLARLAAGARLVEIADELDPQSGLAARLVAHRREPVRVARVRGSALALVANLLAGRSLIAEALGVAESELGRHLTRALDAPLEPQMARHGPCQDVVEEQPDLADLPIPRFFEHEGGPYITAGCIVARDPETGERNWSIARVRPIGGSRALVGIAPNHHLAVAGRAARERGERLPIAVTIGNHPALLIAACLYLARGEDELRVAGALLGEPAAARALPERSARGARRVRDRPGGRARPRPHRRGGPGLGVPRRLRALRPLRRRRRSAA